MNGKLLRLQRLLGAAHEPALLVPLDHTLSLGAVRGLDDLPAIVALVARCGATGVILHSGSLAHVVARGGGVLLGSLAVVLHLSGATTMSIEPARQQLLCGVEDAIRRGADAVSVQVNFGCRGEAEMLGGLAQVIREAERLGVPVLAMAYPRDDSGAMRADPMAVLHAARAVAEVGADVVKIPFCNSEAVSRCVRLVPVPVLVAGGPKGDEEELLGMCRQALEAGAHGLCVGRHVFQATNPESVLTALVRLVRRGPDAGTRRLALAPGKTGIA
jgi:DhnA family fructose-bisphosphate aldolase class Ia